jgi:hypothetical protein
MSTERTTRLELYRKDNNLLYVKTEGREIQVHVKQCFPWSSPGTMLSLRDGDDNEVCFIENIDELDSTSRQILRDFLKLSDFVLEVIKIVDIKEDVELRQYDVTTRGGKRRFHTKLDEWPEVLDDGSVLIQDLAGDLFRIKSVEELDPNSQKILSTYVA